MNRTQKNKNLVWKYCDGIAMSTCHRRQNHKLVIVLNVDKSSKLSSVLGPVPWGVFQGLAPPNDCLCYPSEKCAPKRGLCPPKSNNLVPLKCILGPVSPKILLVPPPPSESKVSFQEEKHKWTRAKDLFFGLPPWICGQEWRSSP